MSNKITDKFKTLVTREAIRRSKQNKNTVTFIMTIIVVAISTISFLIYPILFPGPSQTNEVNVSAYSKNTEISTSIDDNEMQEKELEETEVKIDPIEEEISNSLKDRIDISNRRSVKWDDFDISNGGIDLNAEIGSSENDEIKGTVSIEEVGIKNIPIRRGTGAGSGDRSPEQGDFDRLYQACTVRSLEVLGGDNFVLASHSTPNDFFSKDNNSFSRLLSSKTQTNYATDDINDLLLKEKGGIIVVSESSTGYVFKFKIVRIGESYGFASSEEFLEQKAGSQIITLQSCLNYGSGETKKLIWFIGELFEVTKDSTTVKVDR